VGRAAKDHAAGQGALEYFWLNKGPWSILDDHQSFLPAEVGGITMPEEAGSGNFYPEGATKAALESWMNALPAADKEQAQWFFTTIRKNKDGQFVTVKYSDEYKAELERAAACSSRPPPIPITPR
jgi:hypothetical protein